MLSFGFAFGLYGQRCPRSATPQYLQLTKSFIVVRFLSFCFVLPLSWLWLAADPCGCSALWLSVKAAYICCCYIRPQLLFMACFSRSGLLCMVYIPLGIIRLLSCVYAALVYMSAISRLPPYNKANRQNSSSIFYKRLFGLNSIFCLFPRSFSTRYNKLLPFLLIRDLR